MIVTDKVALSKPTELVNSFSEAYSIIDNLYAEMVRHPALGLAANQIGIDKSVFVISIPETTEEGKTFYYTQHFVNPEIVSLQEPFWFTGEGCLSFPDTPRFTTLRYGKVIIKDMLSPEGRAFTGLAAVVVQHESDHIFGKTFHQAAKSALGPNSQCPCRSGKKFKKCCQTVVR